MVLWGGAVFLMVFFLNRLVRVLVPFGSAYSGVRAAICLKLPSMAILPWVLGSLLRKNAIKNNAPPHRTIPPPSAAVSSQPILFGVISFGLQKNMGLLRVISNNKRYHTL